MHELSIALGIVDVVTETLAERGGGRVRSVHVRLGPLSGVAKEALLSAYPLACEGSELDGSALIVEEEPVIAWCGTCLAERAVASIAEMRCAECGAPARQVLQGRSIEIKAMEVEP